MARRLEVALVLASLLVCLGMRAAVGAHGYLFAGSDSYGYNKLADEWRQHGRYALGPPPAPLHWARMPLYPLYVRLVKGAATAEMSGGDGWVRIKWANFGLEVCTALLLYLLGRKMTGPPQGLIAVLLFALLPFNAVAAPAALTESLGTFLTTLTACLLVHLAVDGTRHRLRWFAAAGASLALGILARPDAVLLAPAFLPAVLARPTTEGRLRAAGLALAGFVVVFSPWPIRNLVQFGQAHPLGGRIDRYSRPVEHYEGSWAWMRSFASDWRPMTVFTTCYYDLACEPSMLDLERMQAFESADERAEVRRLLAERRKEGHSPAVSDGFLRLADQRRRAHPVRTELTLPARRFVSMWIADHDELITPRTPAYAWRATFRPLSVMVFFAALLGAIACIAFRGTRLAGLTLALAVYGRTLIMAFTFYCMPRYLLEVLPLAYALAAGGVVVAVRSLRSASSRRKAMPGVESASMKI